MKHNLTQQVPGQPASPGGPPAAPSASAPEFAAAPPATPVAPMVVGAPATPAFTPEPGSAPVPQPDASATATETKTYNINGIDVELTPDQHKALSGAIQKPLDQVVELTEQVQRLTTVVQQPPAAPAAPAAPVEPQANVLGIDTSKYEDLMITDPAQAINNLINEMTPSLTKTITAQMRGEYNQDQGEQKFWADFYKDNSDLKDDKLIVDAILKRDMVSLGHLTPDVAAKKVADAAREQLLKYKGEKPPVQPGDAPPILETPTGDAAIMVGSPGEEPPAEATPSGQPPTNVVSLSSVLKERQARKYGI